MVDSELLVLLTEANLQPIQGRLFPLLAPLLSGEKDEEMIAQSDGGLGVLDVLYGVDRLQELGAVADAIDDAPVHPLDFLGQSLEVPPEEARQRREAVRIAVRSLAGDGTDALTHLLRAQGLRVVEEGDANFELVITDDYLRPELRAAAPDRPWMPLRPFGSVVWIGPLFQPGRGACPTCMTMRLLEARAAAGVPESLPLPLPQVPFVPAMHVGLGLAATIAARSILRPDSESRLLTFDLKSLELRAHVVVRRPDCPACGARNAPRPYTPPVLESRGKVFFNDGGHRAASPETTWSKYERFVSPLVGVVRGVERAPVGGSDLIQVYVAHHNFLKGHDRAGRARSFGKGMTAIQARTGALCEALERYSAVHRGDEPLIRATLRELGDAAVHPNECLHFSERQEEAGCERFDETRAIDWAPAWSLTRGETRYVAAAYCYFDLPPAGAHRFCFADTNGNAAGSSLEDAALQGLFELVERDAVGIWWFSRARRPGAELRTPFGEAMRREYAALGRRLWLLDLTHDLDMPVCGALSAKDGGRELLVGFGAHFDPAIAASRAITEMNLKLPFVQPGAEVFTGELTDRSFLEPHPSLPIRTICDGSVPARDDLRDDVLACVDRLRGKGLEVLLLDLTREEIGLPVAKVIVPGLRHYRARLGPGRLYDVPLQLGWIDHPLREEDLNPARLGV